MFAIAAQSLDVGMVWLMTGNIYLFSNRARTCRVEFWSAFGNASPLPVYYIPVDLLHPMSDDSQHTILKEWLGPATGDNSCGNDRTDRACQPRSCLVFLSSLFFTSSYQLPPPPSSPLLLAGRSTLHHTTIILAIPPSAAGKQDQEVCIPSQQILSRRSDQWS